MKEQTKFDKNWEQKIKTPGITLFLKKGGSIINKDQPFARAEFIYNKKFKMEKIIRCLSSSFIIFTNYLYFLDLHTRPCDAI